MTRTPLQRRNGIARRTTLAAVSKDRAKRQRVSLRQYGPPAMIAWYQAQRCVFVGTTNHACGYYPPQRPHNEVCHILTRGSGRGHTVDGKANTFTACPVGHDRQGALTVGQVEAQTGLDLWVVASGQRAAYMASRR